MNSHHLFSTIVGMTRDMTTWFLEPLETNVGVSTLHHPRLTPTLSVVRRWFLMGRLHNMT